MIVIACGGRDYYDWERVKATLDALDIEVLIEGGAPGADTLAEEWGRTKGVLVARVSARWDKFGKAAGPMRNAGMLKLKPDLVVAFPGGRGTENMIRQAEAAGVKVMRVS